MSQKYLTASISLIFAMASPLSAMASEVEIEQLKSENKQMKAMLMQMQEQLQQIMIKTNAMEQAQKSAETQEGTVNSKKENITISTTGGGIKVKSSNGNTFNVGGRLMFDHDSFDSFWNAGVGSAEENEIRRSRMTLSGTSGKNWAYKFTVDIDHEDDEASVDTGYLQYSMKPMSLTLGKFTRPAMLEERTSSKWISTIERSIINELSDAVKGKPDFGGVALGFASKGDLPMSASVGVYDGDVDGAEEGDGSDNYGIGARLSLMPTFGEHSFMHLGVSGYTVDFEGEDYRMRSRMGVHTAESRPFETQTMKTDSLDQLGVELAYVTGPFSLQGEYMNVESEGATPGPDCYDDDNLSCDIEMDGYYLQAAYTLTGETRGYKAGSGAFAAIRPKSEGGAWELVARYESADVEISDTGLDSELERWVLGVNWYVNKNVKLMLNYVDAEMDQCNGNLDAMDSEFFTHKACGNGANKDDGNAISLRGQYVF